MPSFIITLPLNGHHFTAKVETDHTGRLVSLFDPLDELPPAARQLSLDEVSEFTLEAWKCIKILFRAAVPLAAHGYLNYEPFAHLAGTATEWPEDMTGSGERPSRAEGIYYSQPIRSLLTSIATDLKEGQNMFWSDEIFPLLPDYYITMAKRPDLFGAAPLMSLVRFSAPLYEDMFLDFLEKRVDNGELPLSAKELEWCVTDRARTLALRLIARGEKEIVNNQYYHAGLYAALDGLVGFTGPEVEAVGRRYFTAESTYLTVGAWILFKAYGYSRQKPPARAHYTDPITTSIDLALQAMLEAPENQNPDQRYHIRSAMASIDSPLLYYSKQEFLDYAFPPPPVSVTARLNAANAYVCHFKSINEDTLDALIEKAYSKEEVVRDGALRHLHRLYCSEWLCSWNNGDGHVIIQPHPPLPKMLVTERVLKLLRETSVSEVDDISFYLHMSTTTLAYIGHQPGYAELTVDYFLDRIANPQNPSDPIALPHHMLMFTSQSKRGDEIQAAAISAMMQMPTLEGAKTLLDTAAYTHNDDLYVKLYDISQTRDFRSGIQFYSYESRCRRRNLRKHPHRKLLHKYRCP